MLLSIIYFTLVLLSVFINGNSEDCLRTCIKDEPPKICYYKFTIEFYPTNGLACQFCTPTSTQGFENSTDLCQCIVSDGVEKTVLSTNRMVPGPHIQVCKYDYIIVDVENKATGLEATVHWHGIFQEGYQYYDGVPYVTQCPIPTLNTFRYQFQVKQSGTYFWHSHLAMHRLDGQYGPMIIREPVEDDPNSIFYDEDDPAHVILISDCLHQLSTDRYPGLRQRLPGQTAENILINGRGTFTFPNGSTTNIQLETFHVKPGTRYRFRLINSFTTVCLAQLNIEDHPLLLIAQDGSSIKPVYVNTIVSGPGERIDFVINANRTVKSYWIQVRGLGECSETEINQLATIQYEGTPEEGNSTAPTHANGLPRGILYNPLQSNCTPNNVSICPSNLKTAEPFDDEILNVEADVQLILPFWFHHFDSSDQNDPLFSSDPDHYPTFFVAPQQVPLQSLIDNINFKFPSAPPISDPKGHEDFCEGPNSNYCNRTASNLPCSCTHIRHIPKNALVEIVLYDKERLPSLIHPFHLHGSHFYVLDMGRFEDNRNITTSDIEAVMSDHQRRLIGGVYDQPSQKDTVLVPQAGWVILRYKATNPGYWFMHCHMDYHSATGMQMIFHVGEDSDLPPKPPGFPTCGSFEAAINANFNEQE
ncbi:laccase-5-like [Chelonus insularis]|uniref:laccase-5-like n=1 Tax=Chelonus insularis TaxID=460826 RepID=UPI00158BA5A3|nr:laccase-5-like [Chelonus insularis]